jgi:hypothetical protein
MQLWREVKSFWEKDGKQLLDVIKMDFERPEWESYDTLFKMNPP